MADRDVTVDILANDKTSRGISSAAKGFAGLERDTKKAVKSIESLPLGQIGGSAANGFVTSFTKGISGIAGQAAPYIAAVGVGAAPLIGATLAGAIIGGAGIGGVIGGLVVASKDVRVQGAADAVGQKFQARLEKAADSFVQPAIEGLDRIQGALDSIDIESIFRSSSQYVLPLADGVSRAVESLGDGIESLVKNAGPAVDAIADGIAGIGEAVGKGLGDLADNGDSAADALRVTFGVINSSISPTLQLINVLTELYEINRKIGGDTGLRLVLKALGQDLDTVGENGRRAGGGTFGAAEGIQKAGDAADEATQPVKSLAEQMSEAAEAASDLFDSATEVGAALDTASEAARENGKSLNANTEKGRENRTALSNVAKALRENYEQYVAVNGAGGKAEGVAEANRAAFVKTARQFTKTAGEAEALADKILGIPKKRETQSVFDKASASAAIAAYKKQIAGIPTYKRTVIEIAAKVTGSSLGQSALGSALNKQSLKFDAMASFASADGSTRSRTGGPATVASDVNLTSVIQLDGQPFYDFTARAISANDRRKAWEQKVGKR